jgi:hypothetical protein
MILSKCHRHIVCKTLKLSQKVASLFKVSHYMFRPIWPSSCVTTVAEGNSRALCWSFLSCSANVSHSVRQCLCVLHVLWLPLSLPLVYWRSVCSYMKSRMVKVNVVHPLHISPSLSKRADILMGIFHCIYIYIYLLNCNWALTRWQ